MTWIISHMCEVQNLGLLSSYGQLSVLPFKQPFIDVFNDHLCSNILSTVRA